MVNRHQLSEQIVLRGHIIDSLILPKVMDTVMDLGGDFDVTEIRVGRHKNEQSFARMKVFASDETQMSRILTALQSFGAEVENGGDVRTEPAPTDGALPYDFYSTTNLPTQVRLNGRWVNVAGTEMDLVIVVDKERGTATCRPIADVRAGDLVAVGHEGIRVTPMEREREQEVFSFMRSAVSSERPNSLAISAIARQMRQTREAGGKILFVVGPAVIHTGAGPYLARLIRGGYVQVLYGGLSLIHI